MTYGRTTRTNFNMFFGAAYSVVRLAFISRTIFHVILYSSVFYYFLLTVLSFYFLLFRSFALFSVAFVANNKFLIGSDNEVDEANTNNCPQRIPWLDLFCRIRRNQQQQKCQRFHTTSGSIPTASSKCVPLCSQPLYAIPYQ